MQINQTQQISGLVTALVAALICVYLYTTRLTVNLTRPDEPDPYIEMEFIEVEVEEEIEVPPPPTSFGGDQAAPAITPEDIDEPSTLAPPTGVSLKDNGPKAEETPKTVTTNRPSPVQTEKVEKPTKPTGPQVDNEQKQKEVQARQTANKSTLAAFNKAAKGNANNRDGDKGTAGRKDGQINSAGPATSKSKTPGVGKSTLPGGWGWPAIPTDIKNRASAQRFGRCRKSNRSQQQWLDRCNRQPVSCTRPTTRLQPSRECRNRHHRHPHFYLQRLTTHFTLLY